MITRMKPAVVFVLFAVAIAHAADNPSVRHLVSPTYPELCRGARLQGAVTVTIHIAADGHVTAAKAEVGHRMLQQAAIENAKTWVFEAEAADTDQEITYSFVLSGDEKYYRPEPTVTFDLPSHVEIRANPPQAQP